MKIFDNILGKEVDVQEEITPAIGVEIKLEDPEEFKEIMKSEEQ